METHTQFGIAFTQTQAVNVNNPLSPKEDEQSAANTPASSQVLLSQSATVSKHTQEQMVEKYEAAVADAQAKSQPVSLDDVSGIKFFNEADVKAYEENLMSVLSQRGIDTSQPIQFGFDYQGNVVVKNDHPDKEAIEAVFKEDMELRNGMVQTSQHYLFKELYALHQQWAQKIESGMSEEMAGNWLINVVQQAVNKSSSEGVTLTAEGFQDPFGQSSNNSLAMNTYKTNSIL
ncbi:hypothetical protein R50073_18120 [Maricurvus nonylphenolicus]|uniref:hypothetical protein n=1 Tax=Maricurvus nonylphenolicus TaxID=1008307 RepID=UPI0036F3B653